eukprot:363632-Chlamydomonas_euryale.AAC.9
MPAAGARRRCMAKLPHEERRVQRDRAAKGVEQQYVGRPGRPAPHPHLALGLQWQVSGVRPGRPAPHPHLAVGLQWQVTGVRPAPVMKGLGSHCRRPRALLDHKDHEPVHYHHHNRTNFTVVPHASAYDKELRRSIFCLAPLGGGHGQRQIIVAAMGCIPVTIGDGVYQPFEPSLDWTLFSVQVWGNT